MRGVSGPGRGFTRGQQGAPGGSQCVGGKALVRRVFQDIGLEAGVALTLAMQREEAAREPWGLEPQAWVSAVHTVGVS